MTEPLRSQTILIVEEDLGFVFWLGQLLTDAGYKAVPAMSCQQAFFHIRHFNVEVDAVFANRALSGISNLLKTLARANTRLRIILIDNPDIDPLGMMIPASVILKKPAEGDEMSPKEWLEKVKTALTE